MRLLQLFVVLAIACASSPPAPVPLEATADSLAPLAGTWAGEYSSTATGRYGIVVFELRADGSSAAGDVVMYTRVVDRPVIPRDGRDAPAIASDILRISFVRVAGGEISGKLDGYPDPVTKVMLSTTFTGRLSGDTIEGTFESRGGGEAAPQRGRWKVARR